MATRLRTCEGLLTAPSRRGGRRMSVATGARDPLPQIPAELSFRVTTHLVIRVSDPFISISYLREVNACATCHTLGQLDSQRDGRGTLIGDAVFVSKNLVYHPYATADKHTIDAFCSRRVVTVSIPSCLLVTPADSALLSSSFMLLRSLIVR